MNKQKVSEIYPPPRNRSYALYHIYKSAPKIETVPSRTDMATGIQLMNVPLIPKRTI